MSAGKIHRAPRAGLAVATLASALVLAACAGLGEKPKADAVFYNAKILTVDRAFSVAEAVAIRNGRFVAVGTNAEVKGLIGPNTSAVDLGGRTVIPGLYDTHTHMEWTGTAGVRIPMFRARTVAEAQDLIRNFIAEKKIPPGAWVQGDTWHPLAQLKEQRYLTRQEIDAAAPNNPVYLPTVGHFSMANSRALELAGVSAMTRDPTGGKIHRDATGQPTGLLEEHAADLVESRIPPPSAAELVDYILIAQRNYNRSGITSVVSAMVSDRDIAAYETVAERGLATVRAALLWKAPLDSLQSFENALRTTNIKDDPSNEWVRIAGIKIIADGGMTLKTAYLKQPYAGETTNRGTLAITPSLYKQQVALANRLGWRVFTHAVGDAAIDEVLDAYEAANAQSSIAERRFGIIHGFLITADQLARAKRLKVRVDGQNIVMWDKAPGVRRFLGTALASRAIPTRSMIDVLGLTQTAAGTDNPVNTLNPFIGMYVMITRKDAFGAVNGPDQAISREEALRLYTNSGPYYSFEEGIKGSIEPGKLADMVVLSADYSTVPVEAIKDIVPLKTIVGGKVVYEAK